MNITFVTIEPPSLKKGAPVRSYNLIKQAAQDGNVVSLITLTKEGEKIDFLKDSLGIKEVISIPYRHGTILTMLREVLLKRIPPYFADYRASSLAKTVLSYAKKTKPDIIQLEELHAYDAISAVIPELKSMKIKIVLDAHNVEHKLFYESIKSFTPFKRLLGIYIIPHLRTLEIKAAHQADYIFTCSKNDWRFFAAITKPEKVAIIPNGVDCKFFTPQFPSSKENSILFMGGTYYPPNNDALRFYFQSIHPLVKAGIPDVKIVLLGGEPADWLKEIARTDKNVITPGLVPDIRPYIESARVCISPMRKGSGTSLKILEYMGSGKAIVSTSKGTRGILCRNNREALIADNPKDFARCIVELMQNDELPDLLGKNARKTAEIVYDWKIIGEKIRKIFRDLSRETF